MVDYQRVSGLPCFHFSGESKTKSAFFSGECALNDVIGRPFLHPSYWSFDTSFWPLKLHSRWHHEISCPLLMNVFPSMVVLVVLLFKMCHDFHVGMLVKGGHVIWYYWVL